MSDPKWVITTHYEEGPDQVNEQQFFAGFQFIMNEMRMIKQAAEDGNWSPDIKPVSITISLLSPVQEGEVFENE